MILKFYSASINKRTEWDVYTASAWHEKKLDKSIQTWGKEHTLLPPSPRYSSKFSISGADIIVVAQLSACDLFSVPQTSALPNLGYRELLVGNLQSLDCGYLGRQHSQRSVEMILLTSSILRHREAVEHVHNYNSWGLPSVYWKIEAVDEKIEAEIAAAVSAFGTCFASALSCVDMHSTISGVTLKYLKV